MNDFEFIKTSKIDSLIPGILVGAAGGAIMQGRRLRNAKGVSARQRHILKQIAKHAIELKDRPSRLNKLKMKMLKTQLVVSGSMKKHPLLATAGSAVVGGAIGGIAARKLWPK